MALFTIAISLLFAGALLSAVARRLNVPYPALLALAGAGLALFPGLPAVMLDPQLALTLFVAPVLLDAAFDSSPRDLRQNWRSVTSLALGAVVARMLMPALSWPSAIALGAIVAPPDAAAATAVLKQLRPPHRLLVILEGESLFNDAGALLIYRSAVVMAGATVTHSPLLAVPMFFVVAAGSVVLGAVLARLALVLNRRVEDVPTAVMVQFISTFLVWMLAEGIHLSGIITMVVYAILVARQAPAITPARLRVPSYAVWEVTVFVLNVLAFILVGLQLKPILLGLDRRQLLDYVVFASAICLAVIVVRAVWVTGHLMIGSRIMGSGFVPARGAFRSAAAIAWCGMRGIVTLAAGLALPADFPHRDIVLFAAFSVVLGTLVVQGATLSPLMRWLGLEDDGAVEREVHVARAETARAALAAVGPAVEDHDMVALLNRKYQARLTRAERAAHSEADPRLVTNDSAADPEGSLAYIETLRRAQEAERHTLFDLRARGVIGDDAFHRVEEELDWAELNREGMARQG
jgi:CPA1 family monovalent cation:H+ antiporter